MVAEDFLFPAYFAVLAFMAAFRSKGLGVCLVSAIGLMTIYPDLDKARFIFLVAAPAYVVAIFRE